MKKYFLILCVIFLWTCGGGGGSTGPEEDTTPPLITIQSPLSGSTIGGIVNIEIIAQDNVGISKVEILVNNSIIETLNTTPYTYQYNTSQLSDGSHTLSAMAYDTSENATLAQPILVNVDNTNNRPSKIYLNVYDHNIFEDSSYRSTLYVRFDSDTGSIHWKRNEDINFKSYKMFKSYSPDMNNSEEVFYSTSHENSQYDFTVNRNEIFYLQLEVENDLGLTTLSNIIPVSTYYTFWYGKNWNNDEFHFAVQLSSGNYLLYGDDKIRETLNFYDGGWNRSVGMTKNDCNSSDNRSDNIENATVSEQAFNFDGQILSINHKNEHILTSHSNAFHVKDYDYNTILTVENPPLYGDNRGYALSHDGGIIFLDWSNEKSIIKYNQNGNEEWKTTNFWSSNFLHPELLSLPSGETIVVFIDSPDGEYDNNDNKRRILKIDNQGNIIHDSSFTQRSGEYRMTFANNSVFLNYKDNLRTTGEQFKMDIIDATSLGVINTVNLNSAYRSSIELENGNIMFLFATGLNFDIHIFDSNGYMVNHFENIVGCDMHSGAGSLRWIIPTIDGGFLVSGGSTIIKFDPNFEFLQKAIHPEEYGL